MDQLIEKISKCQNMLELDNLRLDCVKLGKQEGPIAFSKIQDAFKKQKNKLKRIPLSEREW